MDWNAKWGWENLMYPKTINDIPKQQTTEWEFEEGMMGTGPFRLYEGKNSTSGSELAPGSSARSSISVCTDSSFKEKNTQLASGNMYSFSGEVGEKEVLGIAEDNESPPPLESSVGSGESLIGLKLGKRMYFENHGIGSNIKTASVPEIPDSSTVKKIKSSNLNTLRCQVDGCNLDLSTAKEYHRKHKVCGSHSKCPKVIIGGLERRFCQQCSRFHNLSEFDEKKRSCRRRLSDHNARRRKPQMDPMMRLPSPFSAFTYTDRRPQMSLPSSTVAHVYSRYPSNPTWASFTSKFTTKSGCMLNFGETRTLDEQQQLGETRLPHTISLPDQSFNGLLLSEGTKSETSSQGMKGSVLPPNLDSEPVLHRALSLLSNESWSSFPPPNYPPINSLNHLPLMMQGFQQTSSEFCHTGHQSTNIFAATANDTTTPHFPPLKTPYENVLFPNFFN